MRNKYPGICYRCGELVEKGAGHFERAHPTRHPNAKTRWVTQHADCAIEYRATSTGLNPTPKGDRPSHRSKPK